MIFWVRKENSNNNDFVPGQWTLSSNGKYITTSYKSGLGIKIDINDLQGAIEEGFEELKKLLSF